MADKWSNYALKFENKDVNEVELLVNISKYLPEWVYFYVPPNKVRLNAKEKLKAPAVINQGKINFFVKAKKD